jgi:hypothetical protein
MADRVFRKAVGDDVLDPELVPLELIAQKSRARFVFLTGWIDGRNADEVGGEPDDLVSRSIHFRNDAIDGVHGVRPTIAQCALLYGWRS